MEKTFQRYRRKNARQAFVEAEAATSIATQIRVIRQQRGWSQVDLARRLKTTQGAISRLEDASYGRVNVRTLIELAHVFDTGLQLRFISLIEQVKATWVIKQTDLQVEPFETEIDRLGFVEALVSTTVLNSHSISPSHTAFYHPVLIQQGSLHHHFYSKLTGKLVDHAVAT